MSLSEWNYSYLKYFNLAVIQFSCNSNVPGVYKLDLYTYWNGWEI